MLKKIYIIIVACLYVQLACAQADTIPEPDRMAEDFVRVSLCVADPTTLHDDPLGVFGHAFLRLQCPYYDLDYCFSYEGEGVNRYNFFRTLNGNNMMGMFAVETEAYIEDYRIWNRSVHEYFIDLPPQVEVRLWEIMDNHITNGISLKSDMFKYGCAITVVRYIKRALGKDARIVYAPNPEFDKLSRREIGYRTLRNHPWFRLTSTIFTDSRYDADCPIDEKLIIPVDLVRVWQEAKVVDEHGVRTLATYQGDLVTGAELDETTPWFTPILLAIIMLIISIVMAFTKIQYWDYFLLGLQALIGLILIVLLIINGQYSISALGVVVLFNPLPALFWKWRKYWQMPYAVILSIWAIVFAALPHTLIDPAFLWLGLSYIVMYSKNDIRKLWSTRRR